MIERLYCAVGLFAFFAFPVLLVCFVHEPLTFRGRKIWKP
jgi:hypothetical protein